METTRDVVLWQFGNVNDNLDEWWKINAKNFPSDMDIVVDDWQKVRKWDDNLFHQMYDIPMGKFLFHACGDKHNFTRRHIATSTTPSGALLACTQTRDTLVHEIVIDKSTFLGGTVEPRDEVQINRITHIHVQI